MWCKGKKDNATSLGTTLAIDEVATIFEHIFLWESITALDALVVPDVNIITATSLLFIFAFINFLLFFSIKLLPSEIKLYRYKKLVVSGSFITIKCFNRLLLCLIFCITSSYFFEKITHSASERSSRFSISFSGSDLSSGTAMPVPLTTAR